MLRRFANIETTVEFKTFEKYEAGQIINVNLPKHEINEDMLVSNVNIDDIGKRIEYKVKLVSGESFGGWIEFF